MFPRDTTRVASCVLLVTPTGFHSSSRRSSYFDLNRTCSRIRCVRISSLSWCLKNIYIYRIYIFQRIGKNRARARAHRTSPSGMRVALVAIAADPACEYLLTVCMHSIAPMKAVCQNHHRIPRHALYRMINITTVK